MENLTTTQLPPRPTAARLRTVKLQHLKLALRVDSGIHIGKLHVLRDGRTLLGRAVDVEIPVDDSKASRMHAAIDWQSGFYKITDLGSTNGTFLNGKAVQMSETLTVGDEIRIGSTCFRVEILEEAKNQISKSWVEPTKIVMLPHAEENSVKAKIKVSQEPSQGFRIEQMVRKFKDDRQNFISRHGSWLGVVFVGVVVATAIASNFVGTWHLVK
jgi:pSer/pThr/pTyr-binding forkhead associated (FHA) protein